MFADGRRQPELVGAAAYLRRGQSREFGSSEALAGFLSKRSNEYSRPALRVRGARVRCATSRRVVAPHRATRNEVRARLVVKQTQRLRGECPCERAKRMLLLQLLLRF